MNSKFAAWVGGSVVAAGILIWLLAVDRRPTPPAGAPATTTLMVLCAAGLQPPVSDALAAYEAERGVRFETKFAGSGALLSDIKVGGGDLFIAADRQYLLDGKEMKLIGDIFPLARQVPVIVVAKGNPRKIAGLKDLAAKEVKLSLAEPKLAAIGKAVQPILEKEGLWKTLWEKKTVARDTVNQVANDVKLKAADAGIVWDATAVQYSELDAVHVPPFDASSHEIASGLIASSKRPEQARDFAKYLSSGSGGLKFFKRHGYDVIESSAP